MPFCPQCGYEYEEKIKVCPDCEVKLVDQLLEEHFDGEIVEVFRSFSPAEAGMVKELLYGEGILSALSNELGSGMWGSAPGEAGEVRVYTSDKNQERARELIAAYLEDNPLANSDEYVVCDHCGAEVDPGEEVCPNCDEPFEKKR
jgi:RNA polymerase subunit RPABC4/transcription elongation factor Spt4